LPLVPVMARTASLLLGWSNQALATSPLAAFKWG
jgi:hypothetical protein